jgi:hypothetical protein
MLELGAHVNTVGNKEGARFECGPRILRVTHGDARATLQTALLPG